MRQVVVVTLSWYQLNNTAYHAFVVACDYEVLCGRNRTSVYLELMVDVAIDG